MPLLFYNLSITIFCPVLEMIILRKFQQINNKNFLYLSQINVFQKTSNLLESHDLNHKK